MGSYYPPAYASSTFSAEECIKGRLTHRLTSVPFLACTVSNHLALCFLPALNPVTMRFSSSLVSFVYLGFAAAAAVPSGIPGVGVPSLPLPSLPLPSLPVNLPRGDSNVFGNSVRAAGRGDKGDKGGKGGKRDAIYMARRDAAQDAGNVAGSIPPIPSIVVPQLPSTIPFPSVLP